jgi:hypothetical protein
VKLEKLIKEIVVLSGGDLDMVPGITKAIRVVGVSACDNVPDDVANRVLGLGKTLKKLGVR